MNKLEKEVEQPYADWVNNETVWLALKFAPPGRRGYPDRIILGYSDAHFFIEFKRVGEELEPLQLHHKTVLETMGHTVYVCEYVEDAKELTRAHFQTA